MESYDSIETVLISIKKYGIDKFIIVTGGIGDFFTIDYFFSYSQINNIIFITKQSLKLKIILNFYNEKNKFYALYFNFELIGKPGFDTSEELISFFPQFKNITIINISDYFPLIRTKINSSYIINNNIFYNSIISKNVKKKYNLPQTYAIISPYTEDNRIYCIKCNFIHKGINNCGLTRNFVTIDYLNIFKFLKEKYITGVIISLEPINITENLTDVNIINLSIDKISIIDCIELVKQCNYFFGVDSLFSVIASKILHKNNIYVKCNNKNGYDNKDIYWYPNKNINLQSFIKPS